MHCWTEWVHPDARVRLQKRGVACPLSTPKPKTQPKSSRLGVCAFRIPEEVADGYTRPGLPAGAGYVAVTPERMTAILCTGRAGLRGLTESKGMPSHAKGPSAGPSLRCFPSPCGKVYLPRCHSPAVRCGVMNVCHHWHPAATRLPGRCLLGTMIP